MPDHPPTFDFVPADLQWESTTPKSREYDDVYYSTASGLAETNYVFIQNNEVPTRITTHPDRTFYILETGFGSGLNFLATWHCFQNAHLAGDQPPHLHFISFEKHPISADQLKQCLKPWCELAPLARALIDQYPLLTPGWHRLHFERCTLDIYFGDANEGILDVPTTLDAVYLDGFAPKKNPDLWSQPLLSAIARRCRTGATLATFTAVGEVRRTLMDLGFTMSKVPGFGNKREMLRGTLTKPATPLNTTKSQSKDEKTATIIGAGVSGTTLAAHLARRGWQVRLLDQHPQVGMAASGNKKGVLFTRVSPHSTAQNDFYRLSYAYALRFWQSYGLLNQPGILQLTIDEKAQEKAAQALETPYWQYTDIQHISADQASGYAQQTIKNPALYYPHGAWLEPHLACQRLIQHPTIDWLGDHRVEAINRYDNQWQIHCGNGRHYTSDVVILANSYAAHHLWPNQQPFAELRAVRGQTSEVPLAAALQPNCVINSTGYCVPGATHLHVGATFQPRRTDTEVIAEDHRLNIEQACASLPDLTDHLNGADIHTMEGRAAIRCQSVDYLPLVGAMPNDHWHPNTPSAWPNLYICAAMGSRGFTSAPLATELLASLINKDPLPVSTAIAKALQPDRFLQRSARKRVQSHQRSNFKA